MSMGFFAAGAMGQGGSTPPPGSAFYDAIMAHSPFMYLRLNEASGAIAANSGSGPDGAYSGSYVLGNAALYPGGGTSYLISGSDARASFLGANVPSLATGLTLGIVTKIASTSGIRYFINRDNAGSGAGTRHWQFRNDGANIDFLQNKSGLSRILRPHGMSAGDTVFVSATYDPIAGVARVFKNGSQLGLPAAFATGIDLGGDFASSIVVGGFYSYNDAKSGDYHSEAFCVAGVLTPSQIADIAAAGGF